MSFGWLMHTTKPSIIDTQRRWTRAQVQAGTTAMEGVQRVLHSSVVTFKAVHSDWEL